MRCDAFDNKTKKNIITVEWKLYIYIYTLNITDYNLMIYYKQTMYILII